MIDQDDLPALVGMVIEKMGLTIQDDYLTPFQLSQRIPIMSQSKIESQIRLGKYGKKIGEKGKLVAKISEVKKYNRI